jgi:glycosyltransferase involved in cell wall biosynthesis
MNFCRDHCEVVLTITIPTRNRADFLSKALQSLLTQTYDQQHFEILVVDNGSTDNTKAIVEQFSDQFLNLRYFFDPTPGLHVGRHRGLAEAQGEILVYADDDIRATPTWLEAISENFTDSSVAMVGGNNYPDFKVTPPDWLEQLWQKSSLGGQAIPSLSVLSLPEGRREFSPYLVWGCNFAIRKQVLLDAGGFHPDGMPQELIRFRGDGETYVSKFVVDNGLKCIFDSRASVYHAVTPERMTVEYFRRRAYNQGVSDSYTQLRNGDSEAVGADSLAFLKQFARLIRTKLRSLKPESHDFKTLHEAIREGYKAGFDYHQAAYRSDPEVRAWVHKSDYF